MLPTLFRRLRNARALADVYHRQYAFVGTGSHARQNLYPAIHFLQLPLKYIACTSASKAAAVQRKFPHSTATVGLGRILADPEVAGVFVSAPPEAQFALASQVVRAGKALFVEKPPCGSMAELQELTRLWREAGEPPFVAGLQKRYAPAVRQLVRRLQREHAVSYSLRYLTGSNPEGDALRDLFIHPLDLACHLFGPARVVAARKAKVPARRAATLLLLLEHGTTAGTLELSTAYSWTAAEEALTVNTCGGTYALRQTENLTYRPHPAAPMGWPWEKLRPFRPSEITLLARDSFSPQLAGNQLHSQGFYTEVKRFADLTEERGGRSLTEPPALTDTYRLMEEIRART